MKATGYDRYITIEREIGGDEQKEDILEAKKLLGELWGCLLKKAENYQNPLFEL